MLGIRGWRGLKTENRAENGKQVLKTGLPRLPWLLISYVMSLYAI
jgi:hypothetical protein